MWEGGSLPLPMHYTHFNTASSRFLKSKFSQLATIIMAKLSIMVKIWVWEHWMWMLMEVFKSNLAYSKITIMIIIQVAKLNV